MARLQRATSAAVHATLGSLQRLRRPTLSGQLRLHGLDGAVEILRDEWGVPHIYARTTHDLLFAQGFVHAQDRLWQMDFQRRVVAGRLAEIFGRALVSADRNVRIVGMYRAADEEARLLDAESRAELEAYAAGVNACIEGQPLPAEFVLLRYQPEPWRPAHSLYWPKMVAWGLSINWETELLRARLTETLGEERAAELEPPPPDDWPVVMHGDFRFLAGGEGDATQVVTAVAAATAQGPGASAGAQAGPQTRPAGGLHASEASGSPADLPSTGGSPGSNNWVVSGGRTATGKPLLANDMHLPMTAPSIWYENHLVVTGDAAPLNVTGVTFPGVPYVVAGHNGRVAWGFTNGYPDVQDLYQEHLRRTPAGVEYEFEGAWHEAEVRREEIRIKGGLSVMEEVIVTRHGPVINDLARGLASGPGPDGLPEEPLALRWTSLDPAPMIGALRAMNRAETCDAFREALRQWVAPVQNMVYADTEGNIGYSFPGRVPIRAKGDGRVPVPGWTGEYEWTGYIPFDELPHQRNPASGMIVSANNRVADDSYPYFISREYGMGDRAEQITALLASMPAVDVPAIQRMHFDQVSPSLKRLAAHLGQLEVDDPALQGMVNLVRNWDGRVSETSAAATVCEIFGRIAQKVVFEVRLDRGRPRDAAGRTLSQRALGAGPTPVLQPTSFFYHRLWEWLLSALERPDWHWFDLGNGEQRDDVLRLALRRTHDYLVERLGEAEPPEYRSWAWGRLHMITFAHTLGQAPVLERHFSRGPFPVGGDGNTIFATGGGLTRADSRAVVAPPFRFIADLSDLSGCYGLLAPGNSGRPEDRHYDDQVSAWFEGGYHPMLYAAEDVRRNADRRLALLPGR